MATVVCDVVVHPQALPMSLTYLFPLLVEGMLSPDRIKDY